MEIIIIYIEMVVMKDLILLKMQKMLQQVVMYKRRNKMDAKIIYYIYDIDNHTLVAKVCDPYYLGAIVEGLSKKMFNLQVQPFVEDTEDVKE